MPSNFIQMPPDSTGKKLQTWDNTVAGQDVHAEAVVVTDSTGTEKGTVPNPVRTDPTGSTTQPISGTVTVDNFPASSNPSVAPTGAAVPADATMVGGSDGTDLRALSTDSTGKLNVNIISGGGANASIGVTGTTAPTSATEVGFINSSGHLVSPSSSAPMPVTDASAESSLTTLAGTVTAGVAAVSLPTATVTTLTPPSASTIAAAIVSNPPSVGIAASQTVAVTNVGTFPVQDQHTSLSTAGFQELTDGTNGPVAVKAPSTSAAAGDKALVVAISPNNTPVLPNNAAQETGGNLAAIKADTDKIPSLGQALAAASVPVVLTALQVTALTPPAAITNYAEETGGNLATVAAPVATVGSAAPTKAELIAGSDGTDLQAIATDPLGQVKTLTGQRSSLAGTTWNSSTALNTTLVLATNTTSSVVFSYSQSGTFSTGAMAVEFTIDGTNWTAVPYAFMLSLSTLTTPFAATGTPIPFASYGGFTQGVVIQNFGFTSVRLRLSTVITGTGSPTIVISYATSSFDMSPVTGMGANGAATVGSPVYMGSSDANGILRPLTNVSTFSDPTTGYPLQVGMYGTTNGATSYSPIRIPNVFKTAQATASGNTAVWTPTSGKKFRLMRYRLVVTGNSTQSSAGVLTIAFQDSTTAFGFGEDVYIPTSSTGGAEYATPWFDLGNGYISTTANNVLNVNLSSALTAGNVRVQVCGTEE